MKLYLVTQDFCTGYDTYSGMIVCAENEEDAKQMSPSYHDEDGTARLELIDEKTESYASWPGKDQISHIQAIYIGEARKDMTRGCIIASFHAG